jgi:hypothetical protein
MVLTARQAAIKAISPEACFPLVCDLAIASDLPAAFDNLSANRPIGFSRLTRDASRLYTFFGMIPNFEPQLILPRLAALLRRGDYLLFSANLAPGDDYAAGVRRILPLYNNRLTHDWLLAFLLDLGVEKGDGRLRFIIERGEAGLQRVAAYFDFSRGRTIQVDEEKFPFRRGESIRLFFSYRHTPGLVRRLLAAHRINVLDEWITRSEEEGVFLCARQPG